MNTQTSGRGTESLGNGRDPIPLHRTAMVRMPDYQIHLKLRAYLASKRTYEDAIGIHGITHEQARAVTERTVDQVSGAGVSGAPQWNSNSNYSQGNIVADSSGAGLFYVSLTNNNLGNVLTSVANWRMLGGAIRTVIANTTLLVTDELVRSNSTSGSLTHVLPGCTTTPVGKEIVVGDVGTGGNTTSVKGSGSDPVAGNNTYSTALRKNEFIIAKNMGSGWDVVAGLGVPDGSITGAKIPDASIVGTKLVNATITGTQVSSSINLPGNAVQENGKNLIVSNTNAVSSLSVIRGVVDFTGAIVSGEGFTVSKGTGTNTITFTTPFSDTPAVVATVLGNSFIGGGLNMSVTVWPVSASGATITSHDTSGSLATIGISFIAIGLRP